MLTLDTDIHHGIIIAENYIEYIKDMSLAESVILIESKKIQNLRTAKPAM